VSSSGITVCKPSHLTLRDGAVDGSEDGAALSLVASNAGVVAAGARDHVCGELGFAKDGDTIVRRFADAVETCQLVVIGWPIDHSHGLQCLAD